MKSNTCFLKQSTSGTNSRDLSNNRLITTMPCDIFQVAIPRAAHHSFQDTTVMISGLSKTCKDMNWFFKKSLSDRMLLTLCQAVVDDNRDQVKRLLRKKPELLLMRPLSNEVIESKLTFQKIYAENPLIIAAKRRQIEMIQLMLPYCEKFEPEKILEIRGNIVSAWPMYRFRKNEKGKLEIIIPPDYVKFAKEFIDVIAQENHLDECDSMSEQTKSSLQLLFNSLLPTQTINLNDNLDVELLLLAFCKEYVNAYDDKKFDIWEQNNVFCIRILGLILSIQSPEMAKLFCQSIMETVSNLEEGETITFGLNAIQLKFRNDESFYRSSPDSKKGLGFEFMSTLHGYTMEGAFMSWDILVSNLESLYQIKCSKLQEQIRNLDLYRYKHSPKF